MKIEINDKDYEMKIEMVVEGPSTGQHSATSFYSSSGSYRYRVHIGAHAGDSMLSLEDAIASTYETMQCDLGHLVGR